MMVRPTHFQGRVFKPKLRDKRFLFQGCIAPLAMIIPLQTFAAAPPANARLFPLSQVELLDSPFKENMERNADYLLSLDPDRFLHNTRKYAGLQPKGALYGGWEARGIAGHSLGHYLTALSQQYAATGDKRFADRVAYIVKEMAECQKLYGDGYIGALPPLELATLRGLKDGRLELQGRFNFKGGAWVPWYTQHKILAGLKDAWVLAGNVQAKEVTLKLADWVDRVTAGLTDAQQQTMLRVEFGGMSETLIELYALTGEARYLDASRRFYDQAVMNPLADGRDELPGKHANTQIPKVIGEALRYETTGNVSGKKIAEFFWERVVNHYSWVIGGNSDHEHFFPPDKAANHLGPETAETCNSYNMLKLTEHLFEWSPKVEYADFYERVLYNHILASQEPRHGMFTYFVSLKPGHFRTYSTPTESFWCCVGTGMENHTKYGEAIYFHGNDDLYVNLFIPSRLNWKEKNLILEQTTRYPNSQQLRLTVKSAPSGPLTFHVRCPGWATGPLSFQLNGQPMKVESKPGEYAVLQREWVNGDQLEVTIPMGLHTEALTGAPGKIAFLYGPLVLAGDLGTVPESTTYPNSADHTANDRARVADVPVLVTDDPDALTASLHAVAGKELTFATRNLARPKEITLRPFKDLAYNYTNVYWDVLSGKEWMQRKAKWELEAAERREQEARMVDEIRFGEPQSETDHSLQSEQSRTGDFQDRKWRDAEEGGYFAWEMKVAHDLSQTLRVTYWGGAHETQDFEVTVEGKALSSAIVPFHQADEFYNVEYPILSAILAGKESVSVHIKGKSGGTVPRIFSCAILRPRPPAIAAD